MTGATGGSTAGDPSRGDPAGRSPARSEPAGGDDSAEDLIDRSRPVRSEDAVDVAALHTWLAGRVPELPEGPVLTQFPGGVSNLTFLMQYPDREYVVRMPPRGRKAASSHDMGREVRVLEALSGRFPVPDVVADCPTSDVIGLPFYVMERLRGVILRSDPPPGLDLSEANARVLAGRMIDLLADLHAIDVDQVGLRSLDHGPGYVDRQVQGWSRRFRQAMTDDVDPGIDVMEWLASHQPDDVRRCLIHNDWRLDNLVLDPSDPGRVIGVLDWEMATVGDPLMDLGSALAYWVQSDDDEAFKVFRRQPSHLPGMPTRDEIVSRYMERAGIGADTLGAAGFRFYEVFGLFRLAVIVQQVYYRYVNGQTSNPAFANFGMAVTLLNQRCRSLIEAT